MTTTATNNEDPPVGAPTASSEAPSAVDADKATASSTPSCSDAMTAWFSSSSASSTTTEEIKDAMTALQLDYRFQGDNFGSMWWMPLQQLGFKHHVGRCHYELPKNSDDGGAAATTENDATAIPNFSKVEYDANEIYDILDALAIPQVTSAFDPMPPVAEQNLEVFSNEKEVDWWRSIRDELIFRKFHKDIEKECAYKRRQLQQKDGSSQTNNASSSKANQTTKRPQRKAATITSAASSSGAAAAKDAELFMKKKRKGGGRAGNSKRSKGAKHNHVIDNNIAAIDYPSSLAEYQHLASSYVADTSGDIVAFEEDFTHNFEEWRFLVSTNHSLLLYGAGSKRQLLQRFAEEELDKDGDVLEIDGFDKDVTLERILVLLVDHWLDGREPSSVDLYHIHSNVSNNQNSTPPFYPLRGDGYLVQQAAAIAKRIAAIVSTTLRPLYLVVHNIDGLALRNPTAQEAFSALVSQSLTESGLNAIRLVASVDHVNAPALLWDSLTRHRFQWIWRQVDTQRPYIQEVLQSHVGSENKSGRRSKAGSNKLGGGADILEDPSAQRDSVFSVLKSLASRHTQALQQLAWLQMESSSKKQQPFDDEDAGWVTYVDLLNQCRLKCVVTQDTQLRNYLGELMDHQIVIRNREVQSASATSYRIPYPMEMLDLILDYQPE